MDGGGREVDVLMRGSVAFFALRLRLRRRAVVEKGERVVVVVAGVGLMVLRVVGAKLLCKALLDSWAMREVTGRNAGRMEERFIFRDVGGVNCGFG